MSSETKENIKNKRRIRRRYRLLQFIRLLIYLGIFAVVGWGLLQLFHIGAGVYGQYHAMYMDYVQRKAQRSVGMDSRYDDYLNILLLGVDDGVDGQKPAADTVLFLSLDRTGRRLRLLSVPRGTLVTTASGPRRISEVFQQGGALTSVQAMQTLLGVTIHHHVAIGTTAMIQCIDALGGVEIYVDRKMDYEDPESDLSIHIPQGYQHLDGETALKFLRYRSTEFGDMGRVRRQQHFLKDFYGQLVQPQVLLKLPQIVPILQERVDTSIEVWDSAQFTEMVESFSGSEPEISMLPGQPVPGNENLFIPDVKKIQEKMNELFPLPQETEAAEQ